MTAPREICWLLLPGASSETNLRPSKRILWISEQAKQQLADNRNFGIHTPLMIFTDIDGTTNIFPSDIFGNVRARSSKIRDKDLVELFSTYELQIRKMTTFALAVGLSFGLQY